MADEDIRKQLVLLRNQNAALRKRVTAIEKEVGIEQESPVEEKPKPVVKKKDSLEHDIGMRWFSKVGILALVLGGVFFLKYAFDNDWIGYVARIVIGIVISTGLIISGELASKRYLNWGRTLIGGGFALLYFSIYAAYHFQNYRQAIGLSLPVEIVLLTLVVIVAAFFALRDESRIIATEAFFLGYLTSVLAGTLALLGLFYVLLLTIALIGVAVIKRWWIIGLGGIFASYLVFGFWLPGAESFSLGLAYLIILLLGFTFQSFRFKDQSPASQLMTFSNAGLFYLFGYQLISKFFAGGEVLFTVILAVVYFMAYGLFFRQKHAFPYYCSAVAFVAIAIGLHFEWAVTIACWAILSLLLLLVKTDKHPFLIPYLTLLISLLPLLHFQYLLQGVSYLLPLSVVGIALFAHAWYAGGHRKLLPEDLKNMDRLMIWAGFLCFVFLILLELQKVWISVGWILLAAVFLAAGLLYKNVHLRLQGILLFGLSVVKVFLIDVFALDVVYRIISFVVLGVILLVASLLYNKHEERIKKIINTR